MHLAITIKKSRTELSQLLSTSLIGKTTLKSKLVSIKSNLTMYRVMYDTPPITLYTCGTLTATKNQ